MLITCVICNDLLVASDATSVTSCGHLFHYHCVITWLERSKSCPQCRTKTTDKTLHRIYFNISNQDGEEDTSALQNRIDSLNFEIRLKRKDIQSTKERNDVLENQVIGLRNEVKELESKLSSHTSTISAFKSRVKYLQEENQRGESAKLECTRVRNQLELLKSVETVIKGSCYEVEELIHNYQVSADSIKSLGTFVVILKKELKASTEKRKMLRDLLREADTDIKKIIAERDKLRDDLKQGVADVKSQDEHIKQLKISNKNLQKQKDALEKAIFSPGADNPRDRVLRRLLTESPAPEVKIPKLTDPTDFENLPIEQSPQPAPTLTDDSKDSPYLKIKSSNIGLTPLSSSQAPSTSSKNLHLSKNSHSIFKSSRMAIPIKTSNKRFFSAIGYDGLGGHSILDEFPKPTASAKITKSSKFTIMKGKNALTSTSMLKLDNYFDKSKNQ